MKGKIIIVKNLSKESKEKINKLVEDKEKRTEKLIKEYKDNFDK